jgi:hypothetical protein
VGLGKRDAMIVGRLTGGFPIVVQALPLPDGYPTTGATRSFWDRATEAPPARPRPHPPVDLDTRRTA